MADSSVADLRRSFELHLRAENKAVRTVETYLDALQLAARFLEARGVEPEQARREDIEAFIADQPAHWKPATAANRYRSLRVFYGCCFEARRDTALICSWSPAFPNADGDDDQHSTGGEKRPQPFWVCRPDLCLVAWSKALLTAPRTVRSYPALGREVRGVAARAGSPWTVDRSCCSGCGVV